MGRLTYSPSGVGIVSGVATPTANAVTTVFTIPHGLSSVPKHAEVSAGNALTAVLRHVSWDATNITITFLTAPLAGTLSLRWAVWT